jgi:hypothetical protein
MSEQSPLRNPLLPVVLLTGVIFGLIFVAVRAAATLPVFQPDPVAALPTFEPSPNITISIPGTETPTSRPTWTIRPSASPTSTSTPTFTPTATLYPSLTAARPLQYNDLYRLREWTPEQAVQLVALLQDYPQARFRTDDERSNPQFNEAYYYPAFALQEALLRFPDMAEAQRWEWDLAYSLAHHDPPQAAGNYASLIVQALESQETDIKTLPDWFEGQEPRLELQVIPLSSPPGYSSSQLLQISNGGSAILWLLSKSSEYETYLLASEFDFAASLTGGLAMGDLTGDGVEEVIIFYSNPGDSTLLAMPQIFNLSSTPPTKLSFAASEPFDLGAGFTANWQVIPEDNHNLLQFNTHLLPACPVEIKRSYRWDEDIFKLLNTEYAIQPEPSIVEYCDITVEHAAKLWGYSTSAEFMEAVLPYWPPVRKVDGRLYEADARDEWLYRLGIAHALAGNFDSAQGFLQETVSLPSLPGGLWVEKAQDFLEVYQSPNDLYQACVRSAICDPHAALKMQVSRIPVDRYAFISTELLARGVAFRSNGLFDFDQDGRQERWIIVRHQESQKMELWILAAGLESIQALYVDVVDTAQPSFRYADTVEDPPIVQIQLGQGFKLERLPGTRQPFLTHHSVEFIPTTYTLDTLENASQVLFVERDPASVLQTLQNLQESDRFNCLSFRICDRFYYMLGLVLELNGQESEAVNTYLKLWWEHRDSPFTTMARLKLEQLSRATPLPTGTATQTPRPYPIPIWTPGVPYPFPPATPTSAYPTP